MQNISEIMGKINLNKIYTPADLENLFTNIIDESNDRGMVNAFITQAIITMVASKLNDCPTEFEDREDLVDENKGSIEAQIDDFQFDSPSINLVSETDSENGLKVVYKTDFDINVLRTELKQHLGI